LADRIIYQETPCLIVKRHRIINSNAADPIPKQPREELSGCRTLS